jgi:hypothetical protein
VLNILSLCKRVKHSFFLVINQKPLAAAIMLGNLYYAMLKVEDKHKEIVKSTLTDVLLLLTAFHVQMLWKTVQSISTASWRLKSQNIKKSLSFLKEKMISDIRFYQYIDNKDLINFGQEISNYRYALIAVTRKYLANNGLSDPFKKPRFSYKLFKQGATEQNYPYLTKYFARCQALPIDDIVNLAKKNSNIALLILQDLTNSSDKFEISKRFAMNHACLRKTIAQDWKAYLETFPLTKEAKKTLLLQLNQLKTNYPEFSNVDLDQRVERHQTQPKNPISINSLNKMLEVLSVPATTMLTSQAIYFRLSVIIAKANALTVGTAIFATYSTLLPLSAGLLFLASLHQKTSSLGYSQIVSESKNKKRGCLL